MESHSSIIGRLVGGQPVLFAFAVDHALSVKWLLDFHHGKLYLFYLIVGTPLQMRKFVASLSTPWCLSAAVIAVRRDEYYTAVQPGLELVAIL